VNRITFTVVVPAYNAARTIGSAIRSVLAQTRQDFEVIVVDDGSTDGTSDRASVYESDPRIRVIRQPNRGPSAARNAGIAAARGSYVSTLDADDLWLPEYLEVMGAALEDTPGAGLAYTDAWVLDDMTGRIRRRSAMSYQRPPKVVPDPHSFFRLLLERNFIYNSVTAPRSVLERAGGYDESLWTSEDWELWLRIAATGTAAVRPPGKLGIHRKHSASLTSDPRRIARSTCEVYRRFAQDPNADADVRALAERQLEQWTKMLRDLESPTRLASLRGRAGAIKRQALSRWIWRRPPVAVERTLRAVEGGTLAAP
jgi:glycosyltransferase involved in cell wall biosynthesis